GGGGGGGRVSMTYAGAPALLPLIRDGKVRPIGMTSRNRLPSMPDVPVGSFVWPFGFAAACAACAALACLLLPTPKRRA
ncbi:hypothetical protein IAI18_22905, partial [Acetobacteraceae bacterium H6797]|nr:hypothetical protein [Acetobacteraceae bacterium H6797]